MLTCAEIQILSSAWSKAAYLVSGRLTTFSFLCYLRICAAVAFVASAIQAFKESSWELQAPSSFAPLHAIFPGAPYTGLF